MKIDFSYTAQNQQAEIEYYNVRGQIVKTYPLSELEKWVWMNGLNLTSVSANGCIISDPNIIEKEIEEDIDTYIDNNWRSITEAFYNSVNSPKFKSHNSHKQTKI